MAEVLPEIVEKVKTVLVANPAYETAPYEMAYTMNEDVVTGLVTFNRDTYLHPKDAVIDPFPARYELDAETKQWVQVHPFIEVPEPA